MSVDEVFFRYIRHVEIMQIIKFQPGSHYQRLVFLKCGGIMLHFLKNLESGGKYRFLKQNLRLKNLGHERIIRILILTEREQLVEKQFVKVCDGHIENRTLPLILESFLETIDSNEFILVYKIEEHYVIGSALLSETKTSLFVFRKRPHQQYQCFGIRHG